MNVKKILIFSLTFNIILAYATLFSGLEELTVRDIFKNKFFRTWRYYMHYMIEAYALVILRKEDQILFLKRSESAKFAPGYYSLIGGAVEKNETFRQTVVRESYEEVGVTINPDDLRFVHTFYRKGVEHELVACVFECHTWIGEPFNKEPNKHTELAWIYVDNLPVKTIPAHLGALELIAQGCFYSEQESGKVE